MVALNGFTQFSIVRRKEELHVGNSEDRRDPVKRPNDTRLWKAFPRTPTTTTLARFFQGASMYIAAILCGTHRSGNSNVRSSREVLSLNTDTFYR